ncbi:hypothetical protein V6N13_052911 [Hibiscus sabdariffa]
MGKNKGEVDSCPSREKPVNDESPIGSESLDNRSKSDPKENLSLEVTVPREDMIWLKRCLAGKIKSMYNPELVQQALITNGFGCKVSPRHGSLVIVCFDSELLVNNAWNDKAKVLDLWFEFIEPLVSSESNERVKLWLILEEVPLRIWHESFFSRIGNMWGSLIRIEEETLLSDRFNRAKMLILVQKKTYIPTSLVVTVDRKKFKVVVSMENFEEEMVWIDGRKANSQGYESSCENEDCLSPKSLGSRLDEWVSESDPSTQEANFGVSKEAGGVIVRGGSLNNSQVENDPVLQTSNVLAWEGQVAATHVETNPKENFEGLINKGTYSISSGGGLLEVPIVDLGPMRVKSPV